MPTKLEIFAAEQANDGKIILYPEGMFYKAYEKSAFLLCTQVHPFKVSTRQIKGLDEVLVSVGFPFSSLEKFSSKMIVENRGDVLTLLFPEVKPDISGFFEWKSKYSIPINRKRSAGVGLNRPSNGFDAFPVYAAAYSFVRELCIVCSKIPREYKYSLGEEARLAGMRMLVFICEALKATVPSAILLHLKEARLKLVEAQICLRLLDDLHIVSDKRYAGFVEMTEDISKQLYGWEKSEKVSRPE